MLNLIGIRLSKRTIEVHLYEKMITIVFPKKENRRKKYGFVCIINYNVKEYKHCMECNLIKLNGFFGVVFSN